MGRAAAVPPVALRAPYVIQNRQEEERKPTGQAIIAFAELDAHNCV